MLAIFERKCRERGIAISEAAKFATPLQEATQRSVDHLAVIVLVSPRSGKTEKTTEWRAVLEKSFEEKTKC